jgi:hypothetical protein
MMKLGVMRAVCDTILPGGRYPAAEEVLAPPLEYDAGSVRRAGSTMPTSKKIPLFMLMSNVLSYASLPLIVAEGLDASEPDWLKGLRRRLQVKIEKYRGELRAA